MTDNFSKLTCQDYLKLAEKEDVHTLVREFYYGKCLTLMDPSDSRYDQVLERYHFCKNHSQSSLSERVIQLVTVTKDDVKDAQQAAHMILTEDFTFNWNHFSKESMLKGFERESNEMLQSSSSNNSNGAEVPSGEQNASFLDDSDNEMFAHCAQFIKQKSQYIHTMLLSKWNQFVQMKKQSNSDITVDHVKEFLTFDLPYYSLNRLQLMSQPELFSYFIYEHLIPGRSSILSFMSLMSFLERALQDLIYIDMNKTEQSYFVTHLPKINDLLVRQDLRNILGDDVIFLFRAFFGPLNSLNLRNVTLHGFITGGVGQEKEGDEFSPCYTSFLIVLFASLNDLIDPWLKKRTRGRVFQPVLRLDELRLEQTTQDSAILNPNQFVINYDILSTLKTQSEVQKLAEFFDRSYFVLPKWKDTWIAAICQYYLSASDSHGVKSIDYYNFCMLMFPILEHAIRRIFVSVNNCAERLLTAERNSYYTTLDILLSIIPSTFLPDGVNHIFDELGQKGHHLTNALFDLLIWQDCLRVRDLIAHGGVDPLSVDKHVADELLMLCLALCAQYDPINTELTYSEEYLNQLPEIVRFSVDFFENIYQPAYHAYLAADRAIRDALVRIEEFKHFCETIGVEDESDADLKRLVASTTQAYIQKLDAFDIAKECTAYQSSSSALIGRSASLTLSERHVKKAHLLRRIGQYCSLIVQKIFEFHKSMLEKVTAKKASSKQREQFSYMLSHCDTYLRMLQFYCICSFVDYSHRGDARWEQNSKLAIACEKTCGSLCSSIKGNKWQRAFETCVASVTDTPPPLQSLSPKEAVRLYPNFELLLGTLQSVQPISK